MHENKHNGSEHALFQKIYPSQLVRDDIFFMKLAYNQSIEAWHHDEVPVGAIIEHDGEVIASAYNQVEAMSDPTAHAEILAITQASKHIGDWRLNGATLFVTKEPCPMCSGAAIMARLSRVVFAVSDFKMGCFGGATDINILPDFNHHLEIKRGVFENECRELLQAFFLKKRNTKSDHRKK